MRRRIFLRLALVSLLFTLAVGARLFYQEIVRTFSDDPSVWEPEVSAFERRDHEAPPPRNAVLFVGSSSIRFWDELAEDMAPLTVIRRGFGGAKLSDLIFFADRIIIPYAPRAIVIHAGGNELTEAPGNQRRTPEQALADFRILIDRVRSPLPDVPIYYLALRPSKLPGARDHLLELIRKDCEGDPHLHYLDASAGLSLVDRSPDPRLIRWDQIHLNREGYLAWAPAIRERLLRDLGPGSTRHHHDRQR